MAIILSSPSILPMGDVISTCVTDWDATVIDSYSGSGQNLDNIEPTPADASSQSANDMYLGATSGAEASDPTFTGTAGDPAAYFSCDGGDYFTYQGTITSFFDGIHKTTGGSDFTVFITFYYVGGATEVFFGNRSAGGANRGIIIYSVAGNNTVYLTQRGNTAASTVNSTGTMNTSAYNVIGISHSHSGNNTRAWINSSTAENLAHTFNTTTTAASGVPSIGAYSGGTSPVANTTRFVGISVFNEYFDDTKARQVIDQYNARHNRTYA